VYWTRHRVTLYPGETLITDGRKSARTKCGNRVEAVAQPATSPAEPPMAKFEQPAHPATAQTAPPADFESSLFNRPGVPGVEAGPPSLITPGNWGGVPIFPPPLPGGLCGPGKKKPGGGKGKKNPCGPVEPVPEPGTLLLFATGVALAAWEVNRRRRSAILLTTIR
jgi:PEP-CTERM motif